MYSWLRRLSRPSPTIPHDPWRGRRDNRTAREKVVSGIRLAFGLVAGFAVILLALGGILSLQAGAPSYGRYGVFASWGMVGVATIILFLTANRWASIGIGFFCGPAVLNSLDVLILGTNPSSSIPYHRLSRMEAAGILVVCVVIIALTWRFAGNHPAPTTIFDRIALTFFVLAAIKQAVIPYRWPPVPLISGVAALLFAWCLYRWQRVRRRRKGNHVGEGTLEKLTDS